MKKRQNRNPRRMAVLIHNESLVRAELGLDLRLWRRFSGNKVALTLHIRLRSRFSGYKGSGQWGQQNAEID